MYSQQAIWLTIEKEKGLMLSGRLKKKVIIPHSEANMRSGMIKNNRKKPGKKAVIILTIALATILSLWYDVDVTGGLSKAIMNSRKLSINLGNGECEWKPAIQYTDAGFPTNGNLTKTIIAGKFSFLNFMMCLHNITYSLETGESLTICCLILIRVPQW